MKTDLTLNIVVPMAGRGSRFSSAGYQDPKPLIRFGGKTMIEWVIDNIRPSMSHRFIFICLEDHLKNDPRVEQLLRQTCPGCDIIPVSEVTQGAACTVLLAKHLIDDNNPLMIANSDQYVEINIDQYLAELPNNKADGLIMTFWSDDPKWSFCKLRSDGTVSEVIEKKVVSNDATVGIYNFSRGCDFVRCAENMIHKNLRVNGEFYVAPVYNQLIEENAKVVVCPVGKEYAGMHGLGTPTDLNRFLESACYKRIS
jgi:NDP-sugar pyrophosphorylase family protein